MPILSELSQLEQVLSEAESCIWNFDNLDAGADNTDAGKADNFVKIIFYTSSTNGRTRKNIATELGGIFRNYGIASGRIETHKLVSELNDSYQDLSGTKDAFYIDRLSKLLERLTSFCVKVVELERLTAELKNRLPIMRKRLTPEMLSQLTPVEGDGLTYNKCLPGTLEAAQHILYFLPQLRTYFTLYSLEINMFVRNAKGIGSVTGIEQPDEDIRKNIFNPSMPIKEAKAWFMQLAKKESKGGNPYLTSANVDVFIDRAFCGETFIEKLSINEKAGDKANIIGLFHLFFVDCTTHKKGRGKIDPNARAEKYIRLITDYFDNWTFKQVKNNFRKGGDWNQTP